MSGFAFHLEARLVALRDDIMARPDIPAELQFLTRHLFWEAIEAARRLAAANGVTTMTGNLDFGAVVRGLKQGKRFARSGWNGKGMFIFLVPGSTFTVNREPLLSILGEGTQVDYHGHVDMRTATGQIVPWLCSQTDMLAEDWAEA